MLVEHVTRMFDVGDGSPDVPEGFVVREFKLEEAIERDCRATLTLVNELEFDPKDFLGRARRIDLTERSADALEHNKVLDGRSNISALKPGTRFVLTQGKYPPRGLVRWLGVVLQPSDNFDDEEPCVAVR